MKFAAVADRAIAGFRHNLQIFIGAVALIAFHHADAMTGLKPLLVNLWGGGLVAVGAGNVLFLLGQLGMRGGLLFRLFLGRACALIGGTAGQGH